MKELKHFVEADLKLISKWTSPGGDTKKFLNKDFWLKWRDSVDQRLFIVQDNNEKYLYSLKKSAQRNTEKTHLLSPDLLTMKGNDHVADDFKLDDAEEHNLDANDESNCKNCELLMHIIFNLVDLVNKLKRKQNETSQRLISLVDEKSNVAAVEVAEYNSCIKTALDIKQELWIEAKTKKKTPKKIIPVAAPATTQNRFDSLDIEDCQESNTHTEDAVLVSEVSFDSQIGDYRSQQKRKFSHLKKTTTNRVRPKIRDEKENKWVNILVIGDSMIKNIDPNRLTVDKIPKPGGRFWIPLSHSC